MLTQCWECNQVVEIAGVDEHVMAFLNKEGSTVIATEIQTDEFEVESATACRQRAQNRLRSAALISEYSAGAKHRYFARAKTEDGSWREVWADHHMKGATHICEVFDRQSLPGNQRLSAEGEWLLPGTAANVAFDAFAPSANGKSRAVK